MATKLFIGGLAWKTDDRGLRSRFEEFGSVKDAVVIQDRETGRSKGFGFVTFEDSESANRAMSMDNGELDGRIIRVQLATERTRDSGRDFQGQGQNRRFGGENRRFGGESRGMSDRQRDDRSDERNGL